MIEEEVLSVRRYFRKTILFSLKASNVRKNKITFIQYESPCWIEENQTDQETDPTTMVKQ